MSSARTSVFREMCRRFSIASDEFRYHQRFQVSSTISSIIPQSWLWLRQIREGVPRSWDKVWNPVSTLSFLYTTAGLRYISTSPMVSSFVDLQNWKPASLQIFWRSLDIWCDWNTRLRLMLQKSKRSRSVSLISALLQELSIAFAMEDIGNTLATDNCVA